MKSRASAFPALFFVFILLSAVPARTAGVSTDLDPNTLYWTQKLPAAVVGSPALSADSAILYVATANRKLYGLDTFTGETNWVVKLPAPPTSSPTVDDDDSVYVGCANGVLYRIMEDDEGVGQIDPLFHPFLGGKIASPAIDDEGIIYAGTTANHLYALRTDGSKMWAYNSSNDLRTPIIADDSLFVVSAGFVLGIAFEDGAQQSSFTPRSAINSTPALAEDGTLYFGANDERIYALDPAGSTNVWKFNTRENVMSSPAVGADGSVFIASDNLRLYRLNTNGVPTVWTNKVITRGPVHSAISIGADGTIYAGCDDHRLYAISGDTGEILWTVKARTPVRSSAVIDSQGVVYFSAGRMVYAVNQSPTEDLGEPAWQMFRKDRRHTARATFGLSATNPPTISSQPTNLTVNVGDTAKFRVRVQSATPVSYQWYFNSNAVSAASNETAVTSSLVITNVETTNAGFYFVIATNAFGSATSSVARLTVISSNGPPRIEHQPTNQVADIGVNVRFSVAASGAQPLSYQWRFNTQPISPALNATATNAALVLTNVTQANQGFYEVVVTNTLGGVTSSVASLTVTTNVAVVTNAVVIVQQPSSLVVAEGTFATFSLVATGSPAPSFQWYFSSNALSAAANPTAGASNLLLNSVQGSAAGFYFAVASNVAGAVTSSVASLTVTNATTIWLPTQTNTSGIPISNAPPFIIQNPANQTSGPSNDVSFTVIAEGAPPLFYQWYVNNSIVDPTNNATATNATFTLTNVQANRLLRVVVSNSFGTATSSNAILLVTNSGIFPGGFTLAAPQPLKLGALRIMDRGVAIDVIGAAGQRLVLEYKNTLDEADWKPVGTNDAGASKLIDPLPLSDRARYYRVRTE